MIEKIQEFFQESKTPKEVEKCIIAGLQAWYRGQNPPGIEELVPLASIHLRQACEEQDLIGWRNFMRGRLSLLWAHLSTLK